MSKKNSFCCFDAIISEYSISGYTSLVINRQKQKLFDVFSSSLKSCNFDGNEKCTFTLYVICIFSVTLRFHQHPHIVVKTSSETSVSKKNLRNNSSDLKNFSVISFIRS